MEEKNESTAVQADVNNASETTVKGNDIQSSEKTEIVSPVFCVDDNTFIPVTVDVLTDPKNGHVVSVSKTGYGINFEKDFSSYAHTVLRFDFTLPDYFQLSEYRRRCITTDSKGETVIDKLKLREFFIVNHLKGWNIPDGKGGVLPFEFESDNIISENTLSIVHKLAPAILDVVLTSYENDVLLV